MRIKDLLANSKVVSSGFPAVAGLGGQSNQDSNLEVTLSSLPASVLAEKGVEVYVAPRFERGQVFETTEEIIEANIPVDAYKIIKVYEPKELRELANSKNTIIVSRHEGTINILKDMYPTAKVYDGNVSADDIKDKHVIGNLPPLLIAECGLYTPVMIKDFDYTKDGDLKGSELEDRFGIDDPFQLQKIDTTIPDFSDIEEIKTFFKDPYSNEGFYRRYEELIFEKVYCKEIDLEYALQQAGYEVNYVNFSDIGADVAVTIAIKNNEVVTFKHSYY